MAEDNTQDNETTTGSNTELEATVSNETEIAINDEVLQEYKAAATKWQKEFLQIPLSKADDVLKYMTPIYGLRGKMELPAISAKSGFGPYNPDRVKKADVNIVWRTIETFMGSDIVKFHPNQYAATILGYQDPTLGDALKGASTAALIMAQIILARGEDIANTVVNGKRNPSGNDAKDLCDGFLQIIKDEVAAGKISKDNGNLYEYDAELTKLNAVDKIKDLVFSLTPQLRNQENFLYCPQWVVDYYNEAYLETHNGIMYNEKYEQPYVEGSNRKITFAPIAEMDGTDYIFLTPKKNLVWGTDNKSKFSTVQIDRFESFRLILSSTCFLGTQFRTLDKRFFKAAKLFKKAS